MATALNWICMFNILKELGAEIKVTTLGHLPYGLDMLFK